MFGKKGKLFGDIDDISVFWDTEESPSVTINVCKRTFQTKWVSTYVILNSSVRVSIHYKLVDTSSGAVLWEQTRTAVNQGAAGGGEGDLIGALMGA
mgnify:CR=1 FL=1